MYVLIYCLYVVYSRNLSVLLSELTPAHVWRQVEAYFPAEDLGFHGTVVEQSVSHHDHSTYCSLPG